MADVTVVIPIFGDGWEDLAQRAYRSAVAQTDEPAAVCISREKTLHEARNKPAMAARTEWLCFLDADDELDPDYFRHMMAAVDGDVLQPAVVVVRDGVESPPHVEPPAEDFLERNHIIVGAPVKTKLFQEVGGFDDFGDLEDWDLWLKCEEAGASFREVPDAIYRVHFRAGSRNQVDRVHNLAYRQVRSRHQSLRRSRATR